LFNQTISRSASGKPALNLALTLNSAGRQITGTISTTNWTAELVAPHSAPGGSHVGKYTMLLPGGDNASVSPSGHGFASLTVPAGGVIAAAGAMADGTVIGSRVQISQDGQWPFYAPLYGGKGMMLGRLNFTGDAPAGILTWIKKGGAGGLYPNGFTNEMELLGSRYTAPSPGIRILNMTNGSITLADGNLSQPITNLFLLTNNTIRAMAITNGWTMKLSLTKGTFTGGFNHPAMGTNAPFAGALLQEQNFGGGYFLGTNQSGSLLLEGN
jgi:hypothetical protein